MLHDLLIDYQNIVSCGPREFGQTYKLSPLIDAGDAVPILHLAIQLPLTEQENGFKETKAIIEQDTSSWASPIVLVKKKDRSTRFCVDYHMVNEVTKKDAYALPRTDSTSDALSGSKWFSTLEVDIDNCKPTKQVA
ncbi:uncharacterized protein LOC106459883 [Limulus polyphemus]|uniref:Uncharacterized protein LOC106459883 n=1 Tax=Limulus polyphemus TaxID=6850 RepID=A0ABM1B539_LIMPO|nr:uncharacterized protein LOC106459883 [Limulus polyphemus]